MAVVGDEAQHHGVPGELLQAGDFLAGLSADERVVEDHPTLD